MPEQEVAKSFLDYVMGPSGVVVLLLTFIVGLHREWWVMGGTYRRSTSREDRLEALVYRTTQKIDAMAEASEELAKAKAKN